LNKPIARLAAGGFFDPALWDTAHVPHLKKSSVTLLDRLFMSAFEPARYQSVSIEFPEFNTLRLIALLPFVVPFRLNINGSPVALGRPPLFAHAESQFGRPLTSQKVPDLVPPAETLGAI
jgi:hypothetical protein